MKSLCSLIIVVAISLMATGCMAEARPVDMPFALNPNKSQTTAQLRGDCNSPHALLVSVYDQKKDSSTEFVIGSDGVVTLLDKQQASVINVAGGAGGNNSVIVPPTTGAAAVKPPETAPPSVPLPVANTPPVGSPAQVGPCTHLHCPHTPKCPPPITYP